MKRLPLLSCLVLALLLRGAALVTVSHHEVLRGRFHLKADEATFDSVARAVALTGAYDDEPGGTPTAFRPPGIILPLAAVYWLFGASPFVAVAYLMVCGMAIVCVAYGLAWTVAKDRRVALAAGVLSAAMPTLIFTSSGIWSEPQAILLTLALLWLIVVGEGRVFRSTRGLILVGVCASITYLTRASAVFLFPFLLLETILSAGGSRRWLRGGALLAVLLLPIGAWGLRNYLRFGEFIVGATVAGEALWGSNNPVTAGKSLPAKRFRRDFDLYAEAGEGRYLGSWVQMDYIPGWSEAVPPGTAEIDVYHQQMRSTVSFVTGQPASFAALIGHKMWRMVTVEPYAPSVTLERPGRRRLHRPITFLEYWFLLLSGVAGLTLLARTNPYAARWLACFALAGVLNVLVTYPNPRFLLPFTSVLIVPSAAALVRVYDAWFAHSSARVGLAET